MMEHSDTNQGQQNVSDSFAPLPTMLQRLNTAQPSPTPSALQMYGISEMETDRGTDNVNKFIEQFCIANDLHLEIGKTRTEKKCSVIAHRVKEKFKRHCSPLQGNSLQTQFPSHSAPCTTQRVTSTGPSFSNPVQSGTHCVSSGYLTEKNVVPVSPAALITKEEARRIIHSKKYKVRLQNNRRSAHAAKVYREIWLRAVSREISKLEEKNTCVPSAVSPTLNDNSLHRILSVPSGPINRPSPVHMPNSLQHRNEPRHSSTLPAVPNVSTLEHQQKMIAALWSPHQMEGDPAKLLEGKQKSIFQTPSDPDVENTSLLHVTKLPNFSSTTMRIGSRIFLEKENERLRGILSQYVSTFFKSSEDHAKILFRKPITASFGSQSMQSKVLKHFSSKGMVSKGAHHNAEGPNVSGALDEKEIRRLGKK